MYPRDIRIANPQEALIVEQALAMYREMREAAAAAPDGQVLSVAESLAISRGRELTCKSLQAVLQEEAQASEKKGSRSNLRMRRQWRTSRGTKADDPHGGGRVDVMAGVLRLSRLPPGPSRSGSAAGRPRWPQSPSGTAALFGRRELVVRSSQRPSRRTERLESFGEHGAEGLPGRSVAD